MTWELVYRWEGEQAVRPRGGVCFWRGHEKEGFLVWSLVGQVLSYWDSPGPPVLVNQTLRISQQPEMEPSNGQPVPRGAADGAREALTSTVKF